jgi:methylated-DNA-[protein]-cysteine S-methyltransferase
MRYASCMIYCFDSPSGPVSYLWDGQRCRRVWLQAHPEATPSQRDPVARWLAQWFTGRQLPLPPLIAPATPFQARMRPALLAIPAGETRTYGALARTLNTSPRALGQALGTNPLPILIPCHRVVAANGPGGFACGAAWKQRLLDLERATWPRRA